MTDNDQQILLEPENPLPDYTIDQLPETMRSSLIAMGWTSLMPVQSKAIPYLMDNRDMIIQSRTGSGKTGAFLIPLLLRINPARRYPQALILVPTRELAGQVYNEFLSLSRDMGLSGVLVYGGVGYGTQLQALREGAQIIVGTPGRVLDHIGRRSLNLDRLSVLVFDEADEMLSMGFYPDMREIRRYVPRERSSWMFSATIPYRVQVLAQEFLHNPEFLSLSVGQVTVQTAEHRIYDVPPLEKDLMLMRLIEMENPDSAIIFCNTKQDVEYLATVLGNYGYDVDLLSGDLDQKEREAAMGRIRRGETRFLVATDVAARGIDISDLSHVIQYDVPKDPDSYVHRAGRTARAGNTGVVITLVANMSERSDLKKIARRYQVDFVELPMPTQEEVEARLAERLIVALDDRYRGARRLERERMKRFVSLVRSLAETDDEVSLLAMLLDDLYHRTFHLKRTQGPTILSPQEPRRDPPRSAPEPSGSAGDGHPNEPSTAIVEGEEGGERKKKKRRRRKKKRGDETEQGGVAPSLSVDPGPDLDDDEDVDSPSPAISVDESLNEDVKVEPVVDTESTLPSIPTGRSDRADARGSEGRRGGVGKREPRPEAKRDDSKPDRDARETRDAKDAHEMKDARGITQSASSDESRRAPSKNERTRRVDSDGKRGRERKESSGRGGSKIEKVLGSGMMSIVEEIEVYDPDLPAPTVVPLTTESKAPVAPSPRGGRKKGGSDVAGTSPGEKPKRAPRRRGGGAGENA